MKTYLSVPIFLTQLKLPTFTSAPADCGIKYINFLFFWRLFLLYTVFFSLTRITDLFKREQVLPICWFLSDSYCGNSLHGVRCCVDEPRSNDVHRQWV